MAKDINKVAIIGAGIMGVQIAIRAARKAANKVSLTDISEKALEAAKLREEQSLTNMVSKGFITEVEKQRIKELITFTPSLEECVNDADLIIEAIIEDVQIKRDMFEELDAIAPAHAILATNSSTIPISRIEDATNRRDKVVNIHFYDTELVPMVDIMGGTATSHQTLDMAENWAKAIDCVPIKLKREILGFCMNHLWHAARIEALNMWADGYADYQDIDRAWMIFMGTPYGPFGIMDKVGLDTVYHVHDFYYHETKDPAKRPPEKLKQMLERKDLGEKTGKGFYSHPNPEYSKPEFLRG